jgi:mono/diheme cytochrome c family protein
MISLKRGTTRYIILAVAMHASLTCILTHARADDMAAVLAGRELAVKKCSACHAMPEASGQVQAHPPAAPSFQAIAAGSRATHEALRAFLQSTSSNVRHPGTMPHPTLTEAQIDLIFAYIASLRNQP